MYCRSFLHTALGALRAGKSVMRLAKSREWTEAEVREAIAAIKTEPGLWAELENIEKNNR
jgi:hypothetical protein